MTKERRQWNEQQELQIIQEVEVNGLIPVLRKYDLSQSLFHKWNHQFNQEGVIKRSYFQSIKNDSLKFIKKMNYKLLQRSP